MELREETLDEIIERMKQECLNEINFNADSDDTENFTDIEKYQRTTDNRFDDDNR